MRGAIKEAIETVLRERGLVFARLEPNGNGGQEWAPLYRGQKPSNEVVEDLVARVAGALDAENVRVRARMQRVYYAARMLHEDLEGTDRSTLSFGLRLLLEKVDEARKLETAESVLGDLVGEVRR